MAKTKLACYAEGAGDRWEAFCLDFEIAVRARSYEEVQQSLVAAILNYVELARTMPRDMREYARARRAPFLVRMKFWFSALRETPFKDLKSPRRRYYGFRDFPA
jgi:hypothetical protein